MDHRQSHGSLRIPASALDVGTHGAPRKGGTKPAPPGKRLKEEEPGGGDSAVTGTKKNRHAFGDVTNQDSAPQSHCRAYGPGQHESKDHPAARPDQGLIDWNQKPQPASLAEPGGNSHFRVQPSFKDIDVQDEFETYTCATYAKDIYANLFKAERLRRPSTTYMESFQSDITAQMRAILVDWMVEVAQEYELVSDTLFLAVSFVDRYLSTQQIARTRLQLVGVSCMLIAAKYEEIYAPQVEEFCFITENTYTRQEIIDMESDILDKLRFECTTPTVKGFLRRFCRAAEDDVPDDRLLYLASYLAELALPEYSSLQFLPSQIAAAAVMVASFTLANISWTPTLQHYCRCTAAELRAPAKLLHGLFAHARGSPLPAIREKFSHPKHKCVASVPAPDGLPEWLFQDGGRRLTPAASAATPPRRTEAPRPMWSSQSISSLSHCLAAPGGPGGIKAYHGSN